jgi:uncharacterized protein
MNLSHKGRIISFSEIFVSNRKFQDRIPYVVSIIETDEGVRLPGIIKNSTSREMKIGDLVSITVEPEKSGEAPAYFFSLVK